MKKPSPLAWPDGVPRFVVRRADDRRYFVYDLLHERRCSRLVIERDAAERAARECERARGLK
jgi:hypothetical protein